MINEKMKILKMLEEGKISSDEAARLLDSIAAGLPPAGASYQPSPPPYTNPIPSPSTPYTNPASGTSYGSPAPGSTPYGSPAPGSTSYGSPAPGSTSYGSPGPLPGASYGGASNNGRRPDSRGPGSPGGYGYTRHDTGADISKKFENFMKDFEPKLQRVAETVVEKTVSAADALSKTFSAPPRPHERPAPGPVPRPAAQPSAPPPPSAAGVRGRNERSFEMKVPAAGSELIMSGLNGSMRLKGYNGDKITAKVTYIAKRGNPPIELMVLGQKFYLSYDENDFEMVAVDAYIPESMFSGVRVTTNNGSLSVSTLRVLNARFENLNGSVEISGVAANDFSAETSNGNMSFAAIRADRAAVENFTGTISAVDFDAAQLKMSTTNGGITLQTARFDAAEYMWAIEANNGRLNMVLPSSIDVGYYIRANAALSEVKIGLTGLSYIANSKSFAEAQSVNFGVAPKKVKLMLDTSNAPLIVN